MNLSDKSSFTQLRQITSVVVLTSFLCLGISPVLLNCAVAAPDNIATAQEVSENQGDRSSRLPAAVAAAVRQELSRQAKVPTTKLKITESSQETWSDGCLGLPQPDELCTQALVEGWRITLSDGCKTWVYRSDRQGQVVRLESN